MVIIGTVSASAPGWLGAKLGPRRAGVVPIRAACGRRFGPRVERLEPLWLLANLPPGFAETPVASGLTNPTAREFSPSGLLLSPEAHRTMQGLRDPTRLQPRFSRDAPISVDSNGGRGLPGVAFDPAFTTTRFVYVYYTATSPVVHNR